jgi:TonB family protein
MDGNPALRRNSMVPSIAQTHPVAAESPSRDAAILVDVLVLSADLRLFEAIRSAVGERNPVWRARSAEESVDLLLTGRCGVLLLDMAAVATDPSTLISQIIEQFPEVVVVVAGRREDEALLAHLISEGLVYRFMHKPLTARRAGMFLQAAIRRHAERRDARATPSRLPLSVSLPARLDPGKWLFVTIGLALFVALLVLLVGDRRPGAGATTDAAPPPRVAPVATPASPQADTVLSRARAAFAAGRYESPPGRNALDLYASVLLARPDQTEARTGLDETIDRVVSLARLAAADGNSFEAHRLLARVQSVDPTSQAVQRLATYLAPAPQGPSLQALATQAEAPPVPAPPITATASPEDMRGPVSTLPLRQATVAAAQPKPAATTRPRITPDPLTPLVSNAGQVYAAERLARRGARPVTPPASSRRLPIAGYTRPAAPEPSPARAAPGLDPGVRAALAMPADGLDRIHSVDPVYPPAALRDHVEGWVELSFTITESGSVSDIEVVDSAPRGVFESAASAALEQWRFRPRLANGQPVAHRSTVTLRFSVDG